MAAVAGAILIFLMLLVCYDVAMRYLFRNPTGWALEVCEYMLVYLTFLGSPWLLREKGHVNVDILFFFFPQKIGHIFRVFTSFTAAIGTLILFIFCSAATWDLFQREITMIKMLTIPKWTLMWVIPFGSLFLCLESFRQFYSHLTESQQESDSKHQPLEAEKS
jgi:TRAP-type C4-dicarboxylate transport system permease small subunit